MSDKITAGEWDVHYEVTLAVTVSPDFAAGYLVGIFSVLAAGVWIWRHLKPRGTGL